MKDKLTTVREALQYYASNCDSKTICTNGKIYPFKAQVALALIDEIIATMDSEKLVEKVRAALIEHGELYPEDLAKVVVNTIQGKL